MPRTLTGIQPSGTLHIGNYFGAMRPAIDAQSHGECFYFIADYHSMTSLLDPEQRRRNTLVVALDWLACGLDPKRSVFWRQSDVPEVAELMWIIGTLTPMGLLERAHSYKDKTARGISPNFGLFAYPVLMAADILLYDTTVVPVGKDQKQHLEITRDIAIKFNNDFKVDFFPVVEPLIEGAATRVMSLRDGTKKMSKSDPSDQSRINLTDDADQIAAKIRKAKTDSEPLPETVEGLKDRPDARNLVNIYAALAGHTVEQVIADFAGAQFGTFKPALADLAVAKLAPITTEMNRLMKDPAEIDRILGQGADRAEAIARPIVDQVYDIVGMIRSRR